MAEKTEKKANLKSRGGERAPKKAPAPSPRPQELEEPGCPEEMRRPPAAWIDAVLEVHNIIRMAHGVMPLVWSDVCFSNAKRQADKCQEKTKAHYGLQDTVDGRQGQCVRGPLRKPMCLLKNKVEDVVRRWYAEGKHYDFDQPGPRSKYQNVTQLIWGASSSVGMALSQDGCFVIANYSPAGNDIPYNYPIFVKRPLEGMLPAWLPHDPDPLDETMAPCREDNWDQYEACVEAMHKAANRRPSLSDLDAAPSIATLLPSRTSGGETVALAVAAS